jgi:flagellar biosynthesis protein FlhG
MANAKTRTISIASGKGGAGKTSVAACLAWTLAEKGRKVCLVDVDLGLSNVDVLLGLAPKYTLEDVILADVPMARAVTTVRPGLDVISGGTGVAALADLDRKQRSAFLEKVNSLDHYDFLFLDNSPGIHRQVIAFCLAAREQIIVLNPEPSSVTDGYALLKVLQQNGLQRPPYILLNRVPQGFHHAKLMERFAAVCKKYLNLFILALGAVPDDPFFHQAAAQAVLPVALMPGSPGAGALIRAATLLAGRSRLKALHSQASEFWNASLINLFQGMPTPAAARAMGETQAPASPPEAIRRLEQVMVELEALGPKRFSGKADDANRLGQAGERLLRLARAVKQGSAPKKRVGVLCPDAFLEALLSDLLREKGCQPVTVNGHLDDTMDLDLLICSVSKPDLSMLHSLKTLAAVPCIWLSEYTREAPVWANDLHVIAVVEKPFSLDKMYHALDQAFGITQHNQFTAGLSRFGPAGTPALVS